MAHRLNPIFLPAIALFLAGHIFGQSQATTGNIEGTIVDPNGAPVPSTTVEVRNQNTGLSRTALSNDDGAFMFVLLPSGLYTLTANATQGFARYQQRDVEITVGAKVSVAIRLQTGTSVTRVDVFVNNGGIEPSQTSITSTIEKVRIETLPGLLRNFQENAMRVPVIIRDKTRGGDFSTAGQKGSFNSLQVDGVSNDNTYFAQAVGRVGADRIPFQFSQESIKEYQISTAGAPAEFGRAPGAIVNVITKSGSNRFTGTAFYFLRDEALTANSPRIKADQSLSNMPNTRVPQHTDELGVVLGGPLRKDKIFFFASFNHRDLTFTNTPFLRSLQFAPQNVQQLISPKMFSYCPCGPNEAFLFKIDAAINDRNQLWVRSNAQRANMTSYSNQRANAPFENDGSFVVKTFTVAGGLTTTLSNEWFNEFRFQYLRDRESERPNSDLVGLTLTTPSANGFTDSAFNLGANTSLAREVTIDRVQLVDNVTRVFDKHTAKFGVDLLFDRTYALSSSFPVGAYVFDNYQNLSLQLSAPATQRATRYRQSFYIDGPATHPNNHEYGFYVQDEWRVDRRLTLNFGLRYDYQRIASSGTRNPDPDLIAAGLDTSFAPSDKNNLAPRAGISYAFDPSTAVRAGYGIFYGRTPGVVTATALSQNGIRSRLLDVNCSTGLCPIYPARFAALPPAAEQVPFNIFLFDRDYSQPLIHQIHAEFERMIFPRTTLSIQYVMFRGAELPHTRNANLNAPVATTYPVFVNNAPTGETFTFRRFSNPRRLPRFQQINIFESSARSFYQGLSFVLERRSPEDLWFYIHYTLANAKDDRPDQIPGSPNNIIENSFDLPTVYGRSDLDLRHRFIFSESYRFGRYGMSNRIVKKILNGVILSGTFTMQSGLPYSANVSNDPNADLGTVLDIVPGTIRNQFSTPWVYILDARLARTFRFTERYRLTLIANGYNVFNRSNVLADNETQYAFSPILLRLSPVSNFGTPRIFVSPTQGTGPAISTSNRAFQVGLKLEF